MRNRVGPPLDRLLFIVGKLGGFGFAPLLVSLASLVSVPLLLAGIGSGPWVSIAVGQAVGDVARTVVSWSWNATGLTTVAKLSPSERVRYYFDSLPPRLLLLGPVLFLLLLFALVWPLEDKLLALLSAYSGAVFGLSGAWVYVGSRDPKPLILHNSIPRAITTLAGSTLVFMTHAGWFFPAMLIIGNLIAVLWTRSDMVKQKEALSVQIDPVKLASVLRLIKRNASGFVIELFLTLRMTTPIMIAPVIAPGGADVVALADKIIRWVNTGMTPIMQFVQTGIPLGESSVSQNAKRGLRVAWIAFPLVFVFVFVCAPIAARLVSANQVHFSLVEFIAISFISASIFTGTVVGNGSLVYLNHAGVVAKVAVSGLVMLITASIVLIKIFESQAVILAFSISELCVCILLTTAVLVLLGKRH